MKDRNDLSVDFQITLVITEKYLLLIHNKKFNKNSTKFQ